MISKEPGIPARGVAQQRGDPERPMPGLVKRFAQNESGATAVEYGLIAAGISVAIITVLQGIGTRLSMTFNSVQTSMK